MQKSKILIGAFAILLAACGTSNQKLEVNKKANATKHYLPYFGPFKVENGDTIRHSIAGFELTSQLGETITNKTFENKIYVADFFFTSCTSICPKMSSQLHRLQGSLKNDSTVMILSHTVNPMNDTVEVLKAYADKYQANNTQWKFVTGKYGVIQDLAKKSYLINSMTGGDEGFIHSETFLLVDKQKHIRGIYDGTDSIDVNRLLKEIDLLKKEEQ